MTDRNVTVSMAVHCRVEGDAPVQEIGQMVAGSIEVPSVTLAGGPSGPHTRIVPLRVELERAHEKKGGG